MATLKTRLETLERVCKPDVASAQLSEAHKEVTTRLCGVGLSDANGLRALVARMESETLTERDKVFLGALPLVEGHTHLSIAKLMIELDDEV